MQFKHVLVLCLMPIASIGFCQNWQPISTFTEVVSNYRINPEPVDSFSVHGYPYGQPRMTTPFVSLWIDSVGQEGGDSSFYFNDRIKEHSTLIFEYKAHFLEKKMIRRSGGVYAYYTPDTFSIHSLANLNDKWEYCAATHDTATVISVVQENVLGQLDSVKVILLSSGDSLLLSKNHGIYSFPDTSGIRYDLIGIEYSPTVYSGQKMPNTFDVYDFEVGDIFVYEYSNMMGEYWKSSRVLNKQLGASGYTYEWEHYTIYPSSTPYLLDSNSTTHNYAAGSFLNHRHGSIYDVMIYSTQLVDVYEAVDDRLYKSYGYSDPFGNSYEVYSSHLGKTSWGSMSWSGGFSTSNDAGLIGYVKSGVVTGDTAIWTHYTVAVQELEDIDLSVKIAPNPIGETLNLILEGTYESKEIQLRIVDIKGVEVQSLEKVWNKQLSFDVQDVPQGIYFLEISAGRYRNIETIVIGL